MSIGSALSNAYSGLVATSRMAEAISSNVANALNENYARRTVELSADTLNGIGAGVRISGIVRQENTLTTAARRASSTDAGHSGALADALARLEEGLGAAGDSAGLTGRVDALDQALVTAAATPESGPALSAVADSARALAASIARISSGQQAIRVDAEAEISRQLAFLNSAFAEIARLNLDIQSLTAGGADASGLMDQRKALIDKVAELIPIKVVPRDNSRLAVFSTGGQQLVDGAAAVLGFDPAGQITPDMTLAGGTLSPLTVNGRAVEIGQGGGLLDGGALSAQFTIRDTLVPEASLRLDAFAEDLITRFGAGGPDTTVTTGLAGLFTDGGGALDLSDTTGLASRIGFNPAADPAEGGAAWRLRDGLYAAAPGDAGAGGLLAGLRDTLRDPRALPAGSGLTQDLSASAHAAELQALQSSEAFRAGEKATYQQARAQGMKENELAATGVNTDQEMQHLIRVEQAYAANARVVSVIDNLMRRLMEI
jgi:flagellar hook-associated protein 1 FlgK